MALRQAMQRETEVQLQVHRVRSHLVEMEENANKN